jgi:hypothetical protein
MALLKAIKFYASLLLFAPYAGLVLLLAVIVIAVMLRDRVICFGLATFLALLLPMLLLSERMAGAYLYVPLIGLTIAIAAIAAHRRATLAMAAAVVLWIPWNYIQLRRLRSVALSQVDDRRRYVDTLSDLIASQPGLTSFLYVDAPVGEFGAAGAIRWLRPGVPIRMAHESEPEAQEILRQPIVAVLHWNKVARVLEPVVRTPTAPDATYLDIGSRLPLWQLEDGWFPADVAFRWTRPHATARLQRPANARQFELTLNIGQQYLERIHRSHVVVSLNGHEIGQADFDRLGYQTVRWKLDPAPAGPVQVSFDTSPPYPGADPLGSAIHSFGFLPK